MKPKKRKIYPNQLDMVFVIRNTTTGEYHGWTSYDDGRDRDIPPGAKIWVDDIKYATLYAKRSHASLAAAPSPRHFNVFDTEEFVYCQSTNPPKTYKKFRGVIEPGFEHYTLKQHRDKLLAGQSAMGMEIIEIPNPKFGVFIQNHSMPTAPTVVDVEALTPFQKKKHLEKKAVEEQIKLLLEENAFKGLTTWDIISSLSLKEHVIKKAIKSLVEASAINMVYESSSSQYVRHRYYPMSVTQEDIEPSIVDFLDKNQRHVYDLIVKRSGSPDSKGLSNFVYANCFCPDRDTKNALNKNKDKFDVIIVGLYDKGLVRPETKYDKFDRPYLVWYASEQQQQQDTYATMH